MSRYWINQSGGGSSRKYIYKDGVWDNSYAKTTTGTVLFESTRIKVQNGSLRIAVSDFKKIGFTYTCVSYTATLDPNTRVIILLSNSANSTVLANSTLSLIQDIQNTAQSVVSERDVALKYVNTTANCRFDVQPYQIAYITGIWLEDN